MEGAIPDLGFSISRLPVYLFWTAVVYVILWLIVRELVCWYYKINRMVSLLDSIDKTLAASLAAQNMASSQRAEITGRLEGLRTYLEQANQQRFEINTRLVALQGGFNQLGSALVPAVAQSPTVDQTLSRDIADDIPSPEA